VQEWPLPEVAINRDPTDDRLRHIIGRAELQLSLVDVAGEGGRSIPTNPELNPASTRFTLYPNDQTALRLVRGGSSLRFIPR
jgi:hypothetical protein